MFQKKMVSDWRQARTEERLAQAMGLSESDVYALLGTTSYGLTEDEAEAARAFYGENVVTHGRKNPLPKRIFEAFINPFTAILLLLAGVSAVTDIFLAPAGEKDFATVLIITAMVAISGVLRFTQETKSGNAAAKLSKMIQTTAAVTRADQGRREIPLAEIAVGDLVILAAGDMVPADLRLVFAKDLFVSQSALTGESEPVEKTPAPSAEKAPLSAGNLAFLGTDVVSGSAVGVVVSTGNDTILGQTAKALTAKPPKTSFEKGVNSVSWILIRFMLVMVPLVLFINGFTKGDWLKALLFAVSVAVGLTPEMLPMIVTTCLARGSSAMAKRRVVIKNLNAIQNLGSMDVLCTDKTGTLTQDKVVLEYHLDVHGNEDARVLRHGFLNSFYQTGLKNLLDVAIINRTRKLQHSHPQLVGLEENYRKVDEIPFDFERRRMSVVVADPSGKTQMITKGAVEEMLSICAFAEYRREVVPLDDALKEEILQKVKELNDKGMRVIAAAQKTNPSPVGAFSVADESDMVLMGYLAFLDPPKETAAAAIKALLDRGVDVKVLTGDNEAVTQSICGQVGLPAEDIVSGAFVDGLGDAQLATLAERTTVFAKLSPAQKARIVRVLRESGHVVGFLGDGINDAPAMKAADAGISVDTAVDIAKESAQVILLEKDLTVLESGIMEGRKTYANMIKYIKMTASANFGNMFSVLIASAFLPFLPMEAMQLLVLNLIYDISCTAIPWDNVDKSFLRKPRKWEADSVGWFMVWMGPVSSVFDILMYLVLYFVVCPALFGGLLFHQLADPAAKLLYAAVFQSGWLVHSMWTQSLIIHLIRTEGVPFLHSRASRHVTISGALGISVVTLLPFTGIGQAIGLAALPASYFLWLGVLLFLYMALMTFVKKLFIRRYGALL